MSDKHTFKDSEGVLVYQNNHAPENSEYWCFAGKMFYSDDWDMEVTFTKKPIQFTAGEQVRDKYSGHYLYTVIGQWKNTVVVVDPIDDEIEYFDDVDLKREV